MTINERVKIDNTIYYVIAQTDNEVCVLQNFEFTDGITRQLKIWTHNYERVTE